MLVYMVINDNLLEENELPRPFMEQYRIFGTWREAVEHAMTFGFTLKSGLELGVGIKRLEMYGKVNVGIIPLEIAGTERFKAPLGTTLGFVDWFGAMFGCTTQTKDSDGKLKRCCDYEDKTLEWCCPSCRARVLVYYWEEQ